MTNADSLQSLSDGKVALLSANCPTTESSTELTSQNVPIPSCSSSAPVSESSHVSEALTVSTQSKHIKLANLKDVQRTEDENRPRAEVEQKNRQNVGGKESNLDTLPPTTSTLSQLRLESIQAGLQAWQSRMAPFVMSALKSIKPVATSSPKPLLALSQVGSSSSSPESKATKPCISTLLQAPPMSADDMILSGDSDLTLNSTLTNNSKRPVKLILLPKTSAASTMSSSSTTMTSTCLSAASSMLAAHSDGLPFDSLLDTNHPSSLSGTAVVATGDFAMLVAPTMDKIECPSVELSMLRQDSDSSTDLEVLSMDMDDSIESCSEAQSCLLDQDLGPKPSTLAKPVSTVKLLNNTDKVTVEQMPNLKSVQENSSMKVSNFSLFHICICFYLSNVHHV